MKDKTASYQRNTVAWMPGVRQAALSSYAVLKHNTIVAERQFLWATFWKFLRRNRNQQYCLTICGTPQPTFCDKRKDQ